MTSQLNNTSFFTFHYIESDTFTATECSAGWYMATINVSEIALFDEGNGKITMKGGNTWFFLDDDSCERLADIIANVITKNDK